MPDTGSRTPLSRTIAALEHDAARLAAALREHNLPGQRSKTAIVNLRRQRRQRNAPLPARPALSTRLNQYLAARYSAEIERRGGETAIHAGSKASALQPIRLEVVDRKDGLTLLRCEGWRYYSRQYGSRPATLAYLCGRDDTGDWGVRVAGTITTIHDALTWITPASVVAAEYAGRRVDRQGDIYAIETIRAHDTVTGWIGDDTRISGAGEVVTSHHWDATRRILSHHPADGRRHADLYLPHPVRFVQQRSYAHGRGGRWGAGD
jgi:hypothetical protein